MQELDLTKRSDRRRAWIAVASAFSASSFFYGVWAARIPSVAHRFELQHDTLSLLLLLLASGALVGFPVAGNLATRFGSARITRLALLAFAFATCLLAIAPNIWLLSLAIFLFGLSVGITDVAMNVWGSELEQRAGGIWLPGFHAMWSLWSAIGALTGLFIIPWGWSYGTHFLVSIALIMPLAFWAMRIYWHETPQPLEKGPRLPILRGKLFLVGLMVLCATLGEGAMADWSALYLIEIVQTTEGFAALGFATFSLGMFVTRLSGAAIIKRTGPVMASSIGAFCAILGASLLVFVPLKSVAILGFLILGLGYALAMPLAIARAAADKTMPQAMAVAGVATFSYGGLLLGPPLIGFLSEASDLQSAFGLLILLGIVMGLAAPSLRPPLPSSRD